MTHLFGKMSKPLVYSFLMLWNIKHVLLRHSGRAEMVVCASYYPSQPRRSFCGAGQMVNLHRLLMVGYHTHTHRYTDSIFVSDIDNIS